MGNNLDELELLRLTKAELSKPKDEKHKYGNWQKDEDEKIKYSRTCMKCGYVEEIITSTLDLDIENVIKKQEKGMQLTDYFCNSTKEDLTYENILFFLENTTDYQSYLNFNRINNKIVEVLGNSKVIDNYNDNFRARTNGK